MFAVAQPSALMRDLSSRLGAKATALVSRDGIVLGADLPAGLCVETFGVMCATLFGAGATALDQLGRAPPQRVVVEGCESRTIITPSGGRGLLVIVVDRAADLERTLEVTEKVAALFAASGLT
jgi:predicted regulator of Ras-like GTPase activity (Roadblock/LC7/MglB family)